MPVIHNLVTIDEHAEFRNDVQISDYEKEETNLSLLRSYLFTATAPQGQESSIGLLRAITESFLNPRLDNRITAIANYGHGKSHLALVLANYFGKPYQSPELKVIFTKIDQSLDNPAQRNRFHEFRENRNEFLVIRLRGDKPQSLREQFVISLEQALKEHPSTQNVEIPFWYQKAEQLLSNLNGDLLPRANQFLETYSMDVPLLTQDVQNRKDASYDMCIKLFTELHGVAPNFLGEISQREMLNWASRNYCGDGKPLGGTFVIFDEFSLYIQRYGQRNAAGELQDLLNGIEDQKGNSVFVAFAQHDPIQVARNTIKATQNLETLEKELNRIPRKVPMYSLMESVINAYLDQPEIAWQKLRADPQVRGPLARASNTTMDLFSRRYEQVLKWETEKFDEIVTKGCFPLHPLTTALLCDLRLQGVGSAGNPRTVLGFVFEQVHQKRDEQVIENGKINWVLPIFLVDYFNEYLPGTSYLLYENALRNLNPEAPVEQLALLKALLLQDLAKLPVRRDTQVSYLAEAAGLKSGEADTHLRKLSTERVIRYDQATKLYSFYPVSANPHRMEEIIDERIPGYKVTWELLGKLNDGFLQAIPVDVPWGNADDWAADEKILTLEFFTSQRLRELISNYHLTMTGDLAEGNRGCVIWLLGETDEEVNLLRQIAAKTLDETFTGENPPAIVLMLPKRPCPDLLTTFIKNKIVENFNQDDRKEVGVEIYNHEETRLKQSIYTELATLRGDLLNYRSVTHSGSRYVIPNAYRAGIQQFGEISLNRVLDELYKLTYRFSPPEFFKEFQVAGKGQSNLRNATRSVANVLLRNSMPGNREGIFAQPVSKRMCENFLLPKWQLLTPDFRIREPGNSRILEAWNYLETTFPAGVKEKRIKDILLKLMNPPYGFDYNTVTLLFSAWVGFHSHDVQVCLQNRLVAMDKLSELLTGSNNSKQFVLQISSEYNLALTRRDSGQAEREIQEIIDKTNRDSFSQRDAQDAITKLDEFCREQSPEVPICNSAQQTASNLRVALTQAEQYDKQANEILDCIRTERSILVVLGLHQKISGLDRPTLVLQTTAQESTIHEKWLERITQLVEQECNNLEAVQRITDIGLNQQKLQELRNQLKKANLPNLLKRVESSLKVLDGKQKEFEAQEVEVPIQSEIRAMDAKSNLQTLYQYRERLKHITNTSTATTTLRNERLRLIEQEISNLELFSKQLIEAVERIDTLDSISDWHRNYYRNYDRYLGTPLQTELDRVEEHVQTLQEFFQSINTISKRSPTSPQEAFGLIKGLEDLQNSFKYQLSEYQLGVLEKAKQKVEHFVLSETQTAKSWYQNVIYQYKQGTSLWAIKDSLQIPPAFLLGDEKANIESLRQEVEQKLELDIVSSIEIKFREIKDPTKRRLCLEKLQKILDE
jgi:hypothetical protein